MIKIETKELRGLFKSFRYAFRGLWFCIKNERNMRIHITAAAIVLPFAFLYNLTRVEYALLILLMGLVMVCELINTAMEALVNLGSPSYDSLARIAKDVAAGAVLMCALAAVAVGIALFAKPDKLIATFLKIATNPFYLLLFLTLIVLGVFFIFKGINHKPHLHNKTKEEVKIYQPVPKQQIRYDDQETVKIYEPYKNRSLNRNVSNEQTKG